MADLDSDSIEVRCTVYRHEDPALYEYITSLPTGRHRRRGMLLRIMNAGIGVNGVVLPVSSGLPGPLNLPASDVGPAKVTVSSVSNTQPLAAPEAVDADDLFEHFRP